MYTVDISMINNEEHIISNRHFRDGMKNDLNCFTSIFSYRISSEKGDPFQAMELDKKSKPISR